MFEWLFGNPLIAFTKGELVLLGKWAPWVLWLAVLLAAALLGLALWGRIRGETTRVRGWRLAGVWALETALVALVLVLLWQPALRVSTLKPQQNVVAVVVDDSSSMAIAEDGPTRREQAARLLSGGLLANLAQKFQVRLYRMGATLERIDKPEQLTAGSPSTRIGDSLRQVVAEASSLPIGAVVMLSDGADNAGGIDLETIREVRSRRIPVHTIGFGREQHSRDIEVADVQAPVRALPDSRLAAQITFRQRGYDARKAKLSLRAEDKVLAGKVVTLAAGGILQTETVLFNAGVAGAKSLKVSVEPLDGEENSRNNEVARLVNVENTRPRVLYLEGEPRWEYKFIRRAVQEDRALKLVTMLRTTQNKVYRQDVDDPKELEQGFPANVDEMFRYHAVVLGTVELGYFTPAQQELLRWFVDRRGGGILWLGGRAALSDGGWAGSSLAELLPVSLPDRKGTFHREAATAELTQAGRESLICRLLEEPEKNAEKWRALPPLADHQEVGAPKPGAMALVEAVAGGRGRMPLLVTQSYGRGRTAVFATGGSWRWQMLQELNDTSHEMFWQQLLRWLVTDTPGRVLASTPKPVLFDEGRVALTAEVRDKNYLPATDTRVEARILGPHGIAATVELHPDLQNPGVYAAHWTADQPGSYVAEIQARRGEEEPVRDVVTFQREDGVAEHFRTEQNRDLLEKLSAATGGRYWRPDDLGRLSREISFSEAGITVRETRELWNMPLVFLLAIALRGSEWLLRRRWGAV